MASYFLDFDHTVEARLLTTTLVSDQPTNNCLLLQCIIKRGKYLYLKFKIINCRRKSATLRLRLKALFAKSSDK